MQPKLIIITSTPAAMAAASASYANKPATSKLYGLFPSALVTAADVAAMYGSGPLGTAANIGRVSNIVISATLTLVAFIYNAPDADSELTGVAMLPATASSVMVPIDYFPDKTITDPLVRASLVEFLSDLGLAGVITLESF